MFPRIAPLWTWTTQNPRRSAYLTLGAVLALWFLFRVKQTLRQRRVQESRVPEDPNDSKGHSAPRNGSTRYVMEIPGQWRPSSFRTPAPSPYPDWSIETTKPLPYRPFRAKYFVTLGLRNMAWDEWIELDNEWPNFHRRKLERIDERGPKCCKTAPEAFDGAVELLEEFCEYLPRRYPSLFRRTSVGIDNVVTGESFNVIERPLKEDPMQIASKLVQDDLALMVEGPDGQYYLKAGAILLPGFWRLADKFGMPLSEIHTSGDVPHFREKLEKGMMNFFRRLRCEAPMLRNNYFFQVDDDLAWSHSVGSEDDEHTRGWDAASQQRAVEHHHFRSERQSLRRLPRSGAVVFTIRTYFIPITELCKEPYVPGRLAAGLRSWSPEVCRYKGRAHFGDILLAYLDEQHRRQVETGLVKEGNLEEEGKPYPW